MRVVLPHSVWKIYLALHIDKEEDNMEGKTEGQNKCTDAVALGQNPCKQARASM